MQVEIKQHSPFRDKLKIRRRAFLPCLKARSFQPEDFDDKAIVDYSEAIKLKPDYAEAYNNRARTYLKKVDFDKAIEDYTKAIELNPQDVDAYYTRGKLYDMNKSNDDRTP